MSSQDDDIVRELDEISPQQQLQDWAAGRVYHNDNRYIRYTSGGVVTDVRKMRGGECCPDFSCCQPQLAWPLEERQKLLNADQSTRQEMLAMSLSAWIAFVGTKESVALVTDAGTQTITPDSQTHH